MNMLAGDTKISKPLVDMLSVIYSRGNLSVFTQKFDVVGSMEGGELFQRIQDRQDRPFTERGQC